MWYISIDTVVSAKATHHMNAEVLFAAAPASWVSAATLHVPSEPRQGADWTRRGLASAEF